MYEEFFNGVTTLLFGQKRTASARRYNYILPPPDVYLLEVDIRRKWRGMKLDTYGVGVLIRVSRSSRVSRIGRRYGMHGGGGASDRRQPNGALAPTLTEPRADFIFHGSPFRIPSIYDRSTLLSTRQGAKTPSTGGSFYLWTVWIYVLPRYEDR